MTKLIIAASKGLTGILSAGLLATLVVAGFVGVDASRSGAEAGCPRYITHWGKTDHDKRWARTASRAGMRWKIRNRLADTVQVIRGIRIEQCKRRLGYNSYVWQCQTSAVVNTCF